MKKIFLLVLFILLLLFGLKSASSEGLTLSASSLTLQKGKSEKLVPQLTEPADGKIRFAWSSSDSRVAAVSGGLVTGKKGGAAEITCSAVLADGTGVSASCTVTVLQPVTALKVLKKSVTVTEGQIRSVYAEASPADASNPDVIWESSDPAIAEVTPAGFVRGISAGVCTALGTAADGSGKTAKAEITVEPRVPVQAVNFGRHKEDGSDYEFCLTLRSLTRRLKIDGLTFTLSIDGKVQSGTFEFIRSLAHGETDRDGWWKHYLLNLADKVDILLTSVTYSDGRTDTFEDKPVIGSFTLKEGNTNGAL